MGCRFLLQESEREVVQSCPTLCDPMDCSPPASSIHGIFQARVLEWGAIAFSRGIFLTQGLNQGLPHCRQLILPSEPPGKPKGKEIEVAQSCPTLCDPMDCSLPGSSVHGIFQAIVLEWIAISFSRGSSQPRDRTQASCIAGRFFNCLSHQRHLGTWRVGS